MLKNKEHKFYVGGVVYVIACWETSRGIEAIATAAKVLSVQEQKIVVVIFGNVYKIYGKKDFGRLVFDDYEKAQLAASKFPKPGAIVHKMANGEISKLNVKEISDYQNRGVIDFKITFYDHEDISIDKIGKEIFV